MTSIPPDVLGNDSITGPRVVRSATRQQSGMRTGGVCGPAVGRSRF